MLTVLLTGANGFLGGHIARELLRRGHRVRAFVRPRSDRRNLTDLPLTLIEGDITNVADVRRAVAGCDAVIHAAALAQVNPARDPAIRAVNLGGTEAVLEAARHEPIRRLVYVGTANVFGFGSMEQPGDETRPFAGDRYGLDYMTSKRDATRRVETAVREGGLSAVCVHPTFMLGPRDYKPTSNAMLLELYRGRVIGYPPGGKNYVYVGDVATATVNALTQGRPGESYILGNQNLTYKEAFSLMARELGVRPPRWPIPPALARLYGRWCDVQANLTGKPALLNSAMVQVANDGHYFRVNKAVHELNLPQTPIQESIRETVNWFREHDYIH